MDDYESSLLSDPDSVSEISRHSHSNRIFYCCFAFVVLVGAGYAYLANQSVGDQKLPSGSASEQTVPAPKVPEPSKLTPDEKEAALKAVRKVLQKMVELGEATDTIVPHIALLNNPEQQLHHRLASDSNNIYQRWVRYFLDSSDPGYIRYTTDFRSQDQRSSFQRNRKIFETNLRKAEEDLALASPGKLPTSYALNSSYLCSTYRKWLATQVPLKKYGNDLAQLLADARAIDPLPAHGLTARQRMSLDAIRGLYRPYCIAPQGIDSADLPPRPQPFFPLCRPFVEQLIYGNQTGETRQYDRDAFVRFQNLINAYVTKGYADQPLGTPLGLYKEAGTPSARDRDWYRLAVLSHILKEYPSAFLTAEQAVAAKKRFPTAPYLATIHQYEKINVPQFINLIHHSGPTN